MSQFINEISAIRSKAASEGVYITAREAEEILKRLKELDKPFIIICPSMMIGYQYFQDHFANQIQIIIPKKRISFKHLDNIDNKNYTPPFSSFYYCYKMNLPRDLIFL